MNSLLVGNQRQLKLLVTADSKIQHLDVRSAARLEVLIASRSLLKKLLLGKKSSVKILKINNTKILTVDLPRLPDLEQCDMYQSNAVHVDARNNIKLQSIFISAKQSIIFGP